MDAEGMRQRVEQLKRQHKAVAKRVSELVLQKHPDYAQELQRVMQLQRSLLEAFKISKAARMSLRTAAHTNLHSSIKVLLCRRRQHRLQSLEATLGQTRALCNADKRLKDLLEEENFAAAIQLCQDGCSAHVRGLACVKELAAKLQDTVVMTEESLDQAMCRMAASGFNYTLYDRIQKAYSLLGKSQSAFDQLHMHFTSTLHNAAFQIVLGYTQLGSSTTAENFQRQQYQHLCSQLPPELYLPCLSDLCKSVWEILKNFYQVLQYHHASNASSASTDQQQQQLSSSAAAYLTQKLAQAPGKLWQDVQSKIRIYLQSAGGASLHRELRFEHAIRMLHLVNRLVSESIRKQILAFFRAYHSGRMETLRMFLENEAWQPVPVKSSFSLADLHEFAPFRSRLLQAARLRQLNSTSASGEISDTASGSSSTTFFDRLDENPFEFTTEENCVEDFFATPDAAISNNGDGSNQQAKRRSSADSEEAEDEDNDQLLRAHHIDEDTGRPVIVTSASSAAAAPPSNSSSRLNSPSVSAAVANGGRASAGIESVTSQLHRQPRPASAGPLITNTLLEVLRLLGRYTQMIHLLKPIAFDVALRMTQLAEYYIYTVYWFYARDNIELAQSCLTSKLSNCLLRIGDQLIQHARLEEDGHTASASASPSTVVSAAVQS
uniref:Vps54_N domain-containing protein n=1 Tax=Macrostomum lignano TaxID=282301 RepID=A0A1I8HBG5_9PLAT